MTDWGEQNQEKEDIQMREQEEEYRESAQKGQADATDMER